MHPNEELIHQFYSHFQACDGQSMANCYHHESQFSDPVFTNLKGDEVGNMWKMLCSRAEDLDIQFSNIQADDLRGSAHWDASYTFSATGRKVINNIDAQFTFKDGKILTHKDEFNLWRWNSMALGAIGRLLGWTPFLKNKIRKQASRNLNKFIEKTLNN